MLPPGSVAGLRRLNTGALGGLDVHVLGTTYERWSVALQSLCFCEHDVVLLAGSGNGRKLMEAAMQCLQFTRGFDALLLERSAFGLGVNAVLTT
ncbi:hypothetical protein [Streptomyces sp. CB02959]|uniref:hypothetical protein n=1 Tax=unclassified Streptomyces TaxID=2593676 RepID=UPI000C2747C7|nr:hypothetical protein [Streptomyces sp. CB02959]PJN32286.1 hypothetical protein CG747_43165 [Streptomyces sp. CB02959]